MKRIFLIAVASMFLYPGIVYAQTGNMVTSDLWIRAVINTVEKGPIEAVWQKGGEDTTARGDRVIWGHFYANPSDVTWGSENNPDLFVKIWFDVSGRIDVNFFHVSVPDIEVYSNYPYDGTADEHGTTTMERRYIRQYYEGGQSHSEDNYEDGVPAAGYSQTGNPSGYSTINNLRIGSMINTVEKGPVDAVWRLGGQDTTSRGDQVVWGHYYANPSDVTWGSQDNPDLFVKIWFDVSGRVDVNFFHVSVPDIEVYSDLPTDATYDQRGTTIMADRYIRHEYWRANQTVDIPWLKEGNFWNVAWHEVEINVSWTGGYGDYDLGSYSIKLGPPQQIAGMQMYELILSGDTEKYTPLWRLIGTDTYGNVYGLESAGATPVLIFSIVDDTWSGSGFYTDFEGETGILVNRNGYMVSSQYTKQSGYSGTLTSVGWSKDDVVYSSGSGCEYFPGYGTICGSTGTGAGPDVNNEMHFEYWSPTAGPVGMHRAYNYEDCIGFMCNERHVEQRIEIWYFGDTTGPVDFIFEDEPDTYADPTLIDLDEITGQVFSVYGAVYEEDTPSGYIDGYSAVVSDELMAQIQDWYPFTAQEGMDIAVQVHDWYKFEITQADASREFKFYLVWGEAETNLNFYLFTAPDNPIYGFLYLGQENWLDTMSEFTHSKGFDGTLASGTYLLGVQRMTSSDFATEYGILVLLEEP